MTISTKTKGTFDAVWAEKVFNRLTIELTGITLKDAVDVFFGMDDDETIDWVGFDGKQKSASGFNRLISASVPQGFDKNVLIILERIGKD